MKFIVKDNRTLPKIKDTSPTLPKVDHATVRDALGASEGLKVKMSRQVRMVMAAMSDEERTEFLDFIEKLSRGELVGEPVSPEEVERLKEEGLDLEGVIASAEYDDEGAA